METDKVFLRFDGIFSEDMVFEPRRGWETSRIANRPQEGDGTYLLELLDAEGNVIIQVKPQVDFRDACFQSTKTMRATRITMYIPYHPDARRLVFRRDEYVIYEAPVAKEPPQVELRKLFVKGETISLSWEASHPADIPLTFNIVCIVDEGKNIVMLARDLKDYQATVSLEGVPGGEGQLAVLATDGLRSSFAVSDPFYVEYKPPEVWITSPQEGTVFPPDQPISLIGQAVDVLGNKLPSEGLIWEVDGRTVIKGMEIAPAVGLEPGRHEASLSYQDEYGKAISSSTTFTIADRNEAQLRYRRVMGLAR